MAWEIVVAALGGSGITAVSYYFANAQNNKATLQRVSQENTARLEQLREEHRNQLLREVIQRRTAFREERLRPLLETIGKLMVVSAKYRGAASDIFMREVGADDVFVPPDVDRIFEKTRTEVEELRQEAISYHGGLGVGGPRLAELIRTLNLHLLALEKQAREYAEMGDAYQTTRERAEAASQELDSTLVKTSSFIEELISGSDLLAK